MSVRVEVRGFDAAAERLARVEDAISRDGVSRALRAVAFTVWGNIKHRSPVGESRRVRGSVEGGGRYRAAWQPPDVSEGDDKVEAVIRNNVRYAYPVTYGSVKGQKPWPRAGARTIEHEGRIYAKGGLASEELARGGVINPMMEKWAEDAVNEILKGLDE